MSSPAAPPPLPVGFRFRPTDEELVRHYLKPKIAGRPHPDLLLIPDVDLSACEPWDLPAKALIKSDDPEWFFFAPLDRKYPGGHRSNRSTAAGYWKATGKDRLIRSRPAGTLIGIKKTLVFHRGRAPRGQRTAWIMHEYRTTEPHLQQGQNGSFVLYRLFNKHEQEEADADSPSTSAPANESENSTKMPPHLLTPHVDNIDPTASQENDPLLDVSPHLPDLQPVQTFDGFPTITSPMRPYSDHPFLGNADGHDFSVYFNTVISYQGQEEALNPATLLMPSSSLDDKQKGVDDTDAVNHSSGTNVLQEETGDDNHDMRAPNNLSYGVSAQLSHLYNQSQHHSNNAELEPPNSTSQFSAGPWASYPQQLFHDVVEPPGSDIINSDAFDGHQGLAAEPTMDQFTVSNFLDPQQGNAARRIRLVHSIQRVSVTEPLLTSHLEREDEAGSCYSTGNSSTTHDEDHANLLSQTVAGEVTDIHDGGLLPAQVVSSVESTEKSQNFSFDEGMSSNAKLPDEANLKRRLKQEHPETRQNFRDGLQDSGHVLRKRPYSRRHHAPSALVVRLLCLALMVILAFVYLWRSSLLKSVH